MKYGRLVQIILLKFINFFDFIVVKQSNMIVKLLVVTYKTMFIVGLRIHILRFENQWVNMLCSKLTTVSVSKGLDTRLH